MFRNLAFIVALGLMRMGGATGIPH